MLRLKNFEQKSDNVLRLKNTDTDEEAYLDIPGAEPVTLVRVSSENLPFGCQCPLCGGLFELPQGILYRIEEDSIPDVDSDVEMTDKFIGSGNRPGTGASTSDADFLETASETSAVPEVEEEV